MLHAWRHTFEPGRAGAGRKSGKTGATSASSLPCAPPATIGRQVRSLQLSEFVRANLDNPWRSGWDRSLNSPTMFLGRARTHRKFQWFGARCRTSLQLLECELTEEKSPGQ